MFSLNTAALAGTVLLTYYVITKVIRFRAVNAFQKQHGCLPPPVHPGSGIIGLGPMMSFRAEHKAKTFLSAKVRQFREFGTTISIKILNKEFVTTADPENIKIILASNFEDFGLGQLRKGFAPLLTGGIFVSDGAQWQHSRALVRPAFTRSQVADLESFETHVKLFIAKIPRDGTSTVDLGPLFYSLTFDQATEFLLGESANSLTSKEGSIEQVFGTAFDLAQTKLGHLRASGIIAYLWPDREFFRAVKITHAFVDKFVEKARALRLESKDGADWKWDETKDGRYVFLNELARATDDVEQMRNEIVSILIAGRDTTASLLTSTFHALARHPDVWAKLKAEVDQLNGEIPNYETLKSMKYVKYVLNEVLRLWPPVAGNARQALKDTYLPRGGGPDGMSPVFIGKGTVIGYNVYAMHRIHPSYGADGEDFRPERWETLRTGWEYLPFNGGPRICVGQQFALTEAGYTVVRLVQSFAWIDSRDDEPWTEQIALTATSSRGARVVLTPRDEKV